MKMKQKQGKVKKPLWKKWWFWVLIVAVLASFGNMGNNKENGSEQEESHIYDNAEVKDVINGSRTEKIGEYSIIRISSEEVTDEALTDWYFNYVEKNDFKWCMILYSDKTDNSGVYAIKGMVEKDLLFEQNQHGDYMTGDSSNSTLYVPTADNTLEIR